MLKGRSAVAGVGDGGVALVAHHACRLEQAGEQVAVLRHHAWAQARRIRRTDLGDGILRGVTRSTLLEVIREAGLPISEKPFTIAEAQAAKEAFITGAGSLVTPVVQVDGVKLGDGKPGPVAMKLRGAYIARAREKAV